MDNKELHNKVIALLSKEGGVSFLDLVISCGGRESAFWFLAYLFRNRTLCRGVQIEPVDPSLEEKWLILKWNANPNANISQFKPSWCVWCAIHWRIKSEWKEKIHLIPVWDRGLEIDPEV